MVDKFKISLWDLFSFFMTGGIILLIIDLLGFLPTLNIQLLETELVKGIFYIVICYTIGIIYEPVSNILFKWIDKGYSKLNLFKRVNKLLKEKDEILGKQVKEILIKKYNLPADDIDYYQFAKSEVQRSERPNDFMIFLSRYGFYRNLTTIAFFSLAFAIVNMIRENEYLHHAILIVLLIIIHLLLYKRAKEFYIYTGNDVYRHFLIGEKEKK